MQKIGTINKVLVIGWGEDNSNNILDSEEVQSCIAVLEEGCQVVLFANIDAEHMVDAMLNIPIYQLPLTRAYILDIIDKEEPDAVYAPFAGSPGWELFQKLAEEEYWQKQGIIVLDDNPIKGRSLNAMREIRKAISKASLRQCKRVIVSSLKEAQKIPETIGGFPIIVRTAENGVSIIRDPANFQAQVLLGLENSAENKVIIEECLSGWKEVAVGVVRDVTGSTAAIYSSENIMPGGTHAEDSMSVSPIQTLFKSQQEYVVGAALQLAEVLDDFVGYCTVRFAIDPDTDEVRVLGLSFDTDRLPDVSLTTGYPLVKVITKLAMGCTLHELGIATNAISSQRLILKVPQFNRGEMTNGEGILGPNAKSHSEKIYAGQNFCEVFKKAWQEEKANNSYSVNGNGHTREVLHEHLTKPYWDQVYHVCSAFAAGVSVAEIEAVTKIDPWFLQQIELIVELEKQLEEERLSSMTKEKWTTLKLFGFSDRHIAELLSLGGEQVTESKVRNQRKFYEIHPSVTCFGCSLSDIVQPNKKIMVITGVSSVRDEVLLQVPAFVLAKEAKQMGFDVVLVSSNTKAIPFWMTFANHLYIDPMNWETIHEIYRIEKPSGVFIEADSTIPSELEEGFNNIGAPLVKVPFELASRIINRDSA